MTQTQPVQLERPLRDGDELILRLRFEPHDNPPATRLRLLLKRALRDWAIECRGYRLADDRAEDDV